MCEFQGHSALIKSPCAYELGDVKVDCIEAGDEIMMGLDSIAL